MTGKPRDISIRWKKFLSTSVGQQIGKKELLKCQTETSFVPWEYERVRQRRLAKAVYLRSEDRSNSKPGLKLACINFPKLISNRSSRRTALLESFCDAFGLMTASELVLSFITLQSAGNTSRFVMQVYDRKAWTRCINISIEQVDAFNQTNGLDGEEEPENIFEKARKYGEGSASKAVRL